MSLSAPFIHRPVATTLLTVAVALAGGIAYRFLPVAPLPQVEFPTISVNAALPWSSGRGCTTSPPRCCNRSCLRSRGSGR